MICVPYEFLLGLVFGGFVYSFVAGFVGAWIKDRRSNETL